MSDERFFVVGGAGFIGSHLVDRLIEHGYVTVFDNLSVGTRNHIEDPLRSGRATLIEGDACDLDALCAAMGTAPHRAVFHLAANPEARWGLDNTRLDLEQGTIATYNVLEAMRRTDTARLVFSSSGTVYGETIKVCREDDLGCLPISLYGASKMAGEALISSFVECFGLRAWIFRFGNVVGARGTHGAALDFMRKLARHRKVLEVLGDGKQAKPYLHVSDCVRGMLFGFENAAQRLNVFNLAPPDVTPVSHIAELCVACSPYPDATIRYTGGDRGWPGDVPRSRMAPSKLAALGFSVRRNSNEAVKMAVAELALEVFGSGSGAT